MINIQLSFCHHVVPKQGISVLDEIIDILSQLLMLITGQLYPINHSIGTCLSLMQVIKSVN